MHKVLKAIREASISVACLLDNLDQTVDPACHLHTIEAGVLEQDLQHIQNQITIIENWLDPFTVAELEEMLDET